jgi:hypothetical protein
MWFAKFKRCKITANGIITVMLYIKVVIQGITTRTAIMITVKFTVVITITIVIDTTTTTTITVVTASNTVIGSVVTATTTIIIITTIIINIAITTSYYFAGLASCTLRDRQGTASK